MILINSKNKNSYREIRLIEINGEDVNYVTTVERALQEATTRNLDLIVINEKQSPFIAKIADMGRLKFEKSKVQKEQKKKQQVNTLKECQLKAVTGLNDIQIKAKKASEHLDAGCRIKAVVRLRGREQQTPELGKKVIETFMSCLSNYEIDTQMQSSGRDVFVILKPSKKES